MRERDWGQHAGETSLCVVIPVKDPRVGKSRLHPPAGVSRSALAQAFHRDTISAAVESGVTVVAVSSSNEVAEWCTRSNVRCIPDAGGGLNAALHSALAGLRWRGPIMILMGDLPCLRPNDLHRVYELWDCEPAYLPDAHGTGTVGLLAPSPSTVPLEFGTDSAARFRRRGVPALQGPRRLRRDVDTCVDLHEALSLGVGPHTALALRTGKHPGLALSTG